MLEDILCVGEAVVAGSDGRDDFIFAIANEAVRLTVPWLRSETERRRRSQDAGDSARRLSGV